MASEEKGKRNSEEVFETPPEKMNAVMPLNELLAATSHASKTLFVKRTAANEEAAEAILALEEELMAALDGDVLRGLPTLIPDASFYALRVGNSGRHGMFEFLPRSGRACVVLTRLGTLVKAALRDGGAMITHLEMNDYQADMVAPYVVAVQTALEMHLKKTEQRIGSYESASILARKIVDVIDR